MPNQNTAFWGGSQGELGLVAVQAVRGDCHSSGNASILPASRRMSYKEVSSLSGVSSCGCSCGFWSLRLVANPNSRSILRKTCKASKLPPPPSGLASQLCSVGPLSQGPVPLRQNCPARDFTAGVHARVKRPCRKHEVPWVSHFLPQTACSGTDRDKRHCFLSLISLKSQREEDVKNGLASAGR